MARPSTYDPAYCEAARAFLADGYSVAAFAGSIGAAKQTVYNWMDAHPEFLDAVKAGQAAAVLWWEDRIRSIAKGEDGNATAAIFGLKNRAPEEWNDKQVHEVTGKDGDAIKTEETGQGSAKLAAFLATLAERS